MTKFLPLLLIPVLFLSGCFLSPDPATQLCESNQGEIHQIQDPMGEGPTFCYFPDNRQCEINALLEGFCPIEGIKVTGFDSNQEVWCASLGGKTVVNSNICTFKNGAICDLNELAAQTCPLHFNNNSWKYQSISGADASVGIPLDLISLDGTDDKPTLQVSSTDINTLPEEAPMGMSKDNVIKDQAETVRGEFGDSFDFEVTGSTGMTAIQNTIGKEFSVLGRFEVCDITFDRTLIFYRNFHQVKITVQGNKSQIISENPAFFESNSENCGDQPAWNFAKSDQIQSEFWQAAASDQLKGAVQDWLTAFNEVKANLQINPDPNSY